MSMLYHPGKANVVYDALYRLYMDSVAHVEDSVDDLRQRILTEAHSKHYSIHPGAMKLYHDLREIYWWSGMKRDIAKFVARCSTCQQVNIDHQKPSGSMQKVCHKHGVIHQDLKLENFLYANATENAQLKAIGFCLSIFFEPETEEGIVHTIVKQTIDFNIYPWARVSDKAKDLVKGMLDANPYNRFTVEEVLGPTLPHFVCPGYYLKNNQNFSLIIVPADVVYSLASMLDETLRPKLLTLLPCIFRFVHRSHIALAASGCITTMAKSMKLNVIG
ncbi:hypothetical protein FXO37_28886 [Capsicum annuum]|nr:hypothetical protein FXO37_28886 [Capsicum annuum]